MKQNTRTRTHTQIRKNGGEGGKMYDLDDYLTQNESVNIN